jgi:hypothetical protein
MKALRREESRMKGSVLMRWVGPAAIAGGVFLVLSDLSGLPITIPYLSTASPSGFDAVGSGLILVALALLLIGMVGLYAKGPAPDRARVIEHGGAFEKVVPRRPVTEETGQEAVVERAETPVFRPSRTGVMVLGAGLVMFLLMRE